MTKKNKNKLNLHPKPKQTVQINRPLLITVAVIVTVTVALAIVGAFTTTKKIKTDDVKTKIKTDKPSVISPELEPLPKDYSDVSTIKKYLPQGDNKQLAMVMRQLRSLQGKYDILRRQLAEKKDTPIKPYEDPKTKQAKSSSLVFSGLDSGVDNLIGGRGSRSRRSSKLGKKDENIVPTKAQEKLIEKQNADARKLAVLKGKDKPEDVYDMHNLIKPVSPYQIQAGTLIPATLITGIDTTLQGTIIAQVRSNMYDTVTGKFLLVPKGSKLLGEYMSRIRAGQRRILLAFNRIIRPDGSSITLGKSFGVDTAGLAGIEGKVDNHWTRIIGASTISTILNIGAGVAADRVSGKTDFPDSRRRAIEGGTKAISDVGQKITSQALAMQPTITLPPGHQFNISVRKDMVLKPYKPRRY